MCSCVCPLPCPALRPDTRQTLPYPMTSRRCQAATRRAPSGALCSANRRQWRKRAIACRQPCLAMGAPRRVPRRARLVTRARGAMQALPGGDEPDFILVSCAGLSAGDGAGELSNGNGASGSGRPTTPAAMVAKRAGEAALRNCGLGYTVVRPGPLMEEPGGYKALVFDQARPRPGARALERESGCPGLSPAAAAPLSLIVARMPRALLL
jgi:hypothetical protein